MNLHTGLGEFISLNIYCRPFRAQALGVLHPDVKWSQSQACFSLCTCYFGGGAGTDQTQMCITDCDTAWRRGAVTTEEHGRKLNVNQGISENYINRNLKNE